MFSEKEIKKENKERHALIIKQESAIANLKSQLNQAEHDYQSLKMAKMMEITDNDLEGAKARLARLIRDVNKCIAVLSDEK